MENSRPRRAFLDQIGGVLKDGVKSTKNKRMYEKTDASEWCFKG